MSKRVVKQSGPPTSGVSTSDMFSVRHPSFKNTGFRSTDLKGTHLKPGRVGSGVATASRGSRPGSTAEITGFMGSVAWSDATRQTSDEPINPRVFYHFHVVDPKETDVHTDGMLIFVRESEIRQKQADKSAAQAAAAKKPEQLTSFPGAWNARRAGPWREAAEALTLAAYNRELAMEEILLSDDERYPTPQHVAKRTFFFGVANNQAGGTDVNGDDYRMPGNKVLNCIVWGEAQIKGYFDTSLQGKSLWVIWTRTPRHELAKKKLLEFRVNPDGQSMELSVIKQAVKNKRDQARGPPVKKPVVKNPIHVLCIASDGVPDIPDGYDDNGFLCPNKILFLGRMHYLMKKGDPNVAAERTTVDNLAAINSGEYMILMSPQELHY